MIYISERKPRQAAQLFSKEIRLSLCMSEIYSRLGKSHLCKPYELLPKEKNWA